MALKAPGGQVVSFDEVAWSGNQLHLRYSVDRQAHYTVRVQIEGVTDAALDRAEMTTMARFLGLTLFPTLLHWMVPDRFHALPTLELNAVGLHRADLAAWSSAYGGILAETFVRRGLPPSRPTIVSNGPKLTRIQSSTDERAILQNGGGRDTVVALEIVKALGLSFRWFTVHPSACQESIVSLSGAPKRHHRCWYWLDRPDGSSRPVPLQWFAVGILVAWATGSRYLLLGHERSANHGNLRAGDVEVNHQYLKSFAFEEFLAGFVRRRVHANVRYLSLLRPLSELQIARIFSRHGRYHSTFRSCNTHALQDRSWCGACAKCAGIALTLAVYLTPGKVASIIGHDMLDDERALPLFRALCGLEGQKPFECVPTIDECQLAAYRLIEQGVDNVLTRALRREIVRRVKARGLRRLRGWEDDLATQHQLPKKWVGTIAQML